MERRLVWLVVTPRTHGIHHSVVHRETQSNFGVVLTIWDRLHRTLRLNVPLTIGVLAYPKPARQTVARLLALPLAPLQPWACPNGTVPERPTSAGPLDELSW
ncbi:MAG: sterol desaturase family protein [Janthinobacterium lividum]